MEKTFDVLMPSARASLNREAKKAEERFNDFLINGVCYDTISRHPDDLVYASAQLLKIILPQIINELLVRGDLANFLLYPICSSIDPQGNRSPEYNERAKMVVNGATQDLIGSVCAFLSTLKDDPPISHEVHQRLIELWCAK